MKKGSNILFILSAFFLFSCGEKENPKPKLKIFSMIESVNGKDTVYAKIPSFSFTDQSGKKVTEKDFEGKIYIANFFFVKCNGICPKMSAQMIRVQEAVKSNPDVKIISHSVDPSNDSVSALAGYAAKYKADGGKWHLVTGSRDDIYGIGVDHYKVPVTEDVKAEGGFLHSEFFILVDKQKHIRGYYDGTVPAEVDRLITDIGILLEEGNNE